jgi:hypothetical protein
MVLFVLRFSELYLKKQKLIGIASFLIIRFLFVMTMESIINISPSKPLMLEAFDTSKLISS